jgi:hypothetical protein
MITMEGLKYDAIDGDQLPGRGYETAECACPDDCERDHGNE